MDIKKSSWHYRIVDFIYAVPSSSLCNYFWQLALVLIVTTAIALGVYGASFAFGVMVVEEFLKSSVVLPFIVLPIIGAIAIVLIFLLSFGFIYLWNKGKTKYSNYKREKRGKEPEPDGILTSYIKAKKAKVCPQLKFIDEEKDENPS